MPVPEIAGKLVIKTGKNAGRQPSPASVYWALADAGQDDLTSAGDAVPQPRPARLSDKVDPERRERLRPQPRPDPHVPT